MPKKNIYSLVVIFAMMSIPYFEGYGFPYSIEVFAYGVGYSLTPVIIGGLAKLMAVIFKYELSFQSWFNGVGTVVFFSGLLQTFNL